MIVGVIPARKGSEGIPGKNMVDLGGRPLLDYTLELADRCRQLDRIVLSTDMQDAIEWTRARYPRIETPFVRPAALCTAAASSADVVLHALDFLEQQPGVSVDAVVLLQPTCPFRRVEEVEGAIKLLRDRRLTALVGVSRVWHHPGDYVRAVGGSAAPFQYVFRDPAWMRRQDFPEVWFITGALYVCRAEYLRRTRRFFDENSYLYHMSEQTMVDIDAPFDLAIARGLVAVGAVSGAGGRAE